MVARSQCMTWQIPRWLIKNCVRWVIITMKMILGFRFKRKKSKRPTLNSYRTSSILGNKSIMINLKKKSKSSMGSIRRAIKRLPLICSMKWKMLCSKMKGRPWFISSFSYKRRINSDLLSKDNKNNRFLQVYSFFTSLIMQVN